MARADQAPTFAAGFDFARQLRDPDIRRVLRALGWTSGQHVVIAVNDEPVVDVVARIVFHETDGRALIAITSAAHGDGPRKFRFMLAVVAPETAHEVEGIDLGPGASIGMLYDALRPSGTYIPSEWVKALQFERVTAAG
jgi:hypothetical protein